MWHITELPQWGSWISETPDRKGKSSSPTSTCSFMEENQRCAGEVLEGGRQLWQGQALGYKELSQICLLQRMERIEASGRDRMFCLPPLEGRMLPSLRTASEVTQEFGIPRSRFACQWGQRKLTPQDSQCEQWVMGKKYSETHPAEKAVLLEAGRYEAVMGQVVD